MKKCTCGAKYTSCPNYHLEWCDINQNDDEVYAILIDSDDSKDVFRLYDSLQDAISSDIVNHPVYRDKVKIKALKIMYRRVDGKVRVYGSSKYFNIN